MKPVSASASLYHYKNASKNEGPIRPLPADVYPSLLTLRQRPRSYACAGDTRCPLDGFDEHLLELRVVPVVLHVSQRCVILASFAVPLGTRDSEVAIGTMDELISQVDLGGIKAHEHADVVPRIVPHLIDFVPQHEGFWPLLHSGERRVFHNDRCVKCPPWMLIVIAADHLPVLWPVNKSNGRAMNTDEALSVVVDEGQEVRLLLGVHFKIAAGKKKHDIKVGQVLGVVLDFFLGQRFAVGAERGIPQTRLTSQTFAGIPGVRY